MRLSSWRGPHLGLRGAASWELRLLRRCDPRRMAEWPFKWYMQRYGTPSDTHQADSGPLADGAVRRERDAIRATHHLSGSSQKSAMCEGGVGKSDLVRAKIRGNRGPGARSPSGVALSSIACPIQRETLGLPISSTASQIDTEKRRPDTNSWRCAHHQLRERTGASRVVATESTWYEPT